MGLDLEVDRADGFQDGYTVLFYAAAVNIIVYIVWLQLQDMNLI